MHGRRRAWLAATVVALLAAVLLVLPFGSASVAQGTGAVSGVVRLDGQPLAGVAVFLGVNSTDRHTCTDANGAFVFTNVPLHTLLVAATGPGVQLHGCPNEKFVDQAAVPARPLLTQFYDHVNGFPPFPSFQITADKFDVNFDVTRLPNDVPSLTADARSALNACYDDLDPSAATAQAEAFLDEVDARETGGDLDAATAALMRVFGNNLVFVFGTDACRGGVERLAGSNRFATAAAISASAFDPGVPAAYVATGGNFPDALAGGPVAALKGGPILLLGSIPGATAAELTRLQPQKIVILGGTGVVSAVDAAALASFTAGSVERLAGANRFATAAAISVSEFSPGVPVVYVATGANFPDALAGGPVAAINGGPILLVNADSIPAATAAELFRLHPQEIVILGGTGVVSSTVETQLGFLTAGAVERLAGSNRFATAAAISVSQFNPGLDVVYIATGANFPDALAGGPVAGINSGPILLVNQNSIPGETATELTRLVPKKIVILGGTGVVSTAVETQLVAFIS